MDCRAEAPSGSRGLGPPESDLRRALAGLQVAAKAATRAGGHLATLAAVAAALPGCLALDGQAAALRWALRRLTGRSGACQEGDSERWVDLVALAGEERAWLGWLSSSVISRLRRDVPLATLLARWVAVLRPDLALHAGPLGRLVAMLRDQEAGGASRSPPLNSGLTTPRHSEEELDAQLVDTFGPEWSQALLLDMLPRGADSVVEIFRAVLCESQLAKNQQKAGAGAAPSRCTWHWWRRRRDKGKAKVAEAPGAQSAAVRARRPGLELCAEADLLLVGLTLRLLSRLGLVECSVEDAFHDFAHFARQQMDLRHEVQLLQLIRSSLDTVQAPRVAIPRPLANPSPEVAIVTWEEGICLSEVIRRPFSAGCLEDSELAARMAAAKQLARVFWKLLFRHGIALGGLCAGNVLLRTAVDDDEQLEVVLLRCGLCHKVDATTVNDVREIAAAVRGGAAPRELGELFLDRVHGRAGGQPEEVVDMDGFFSNIASLLGMTCLAESGGSGVIQPLRGALLLHRGLEALRSHNVRASAAHLQVATSAVATHGVCSRLDPFSDGCLYDALLEVEGGRF
mmetsp:Transcript_57157/g.127502  ORF Transcript_57157/g.127502 Transcript_57157/m.127502 type:complete len:569 (+) Transcript_57157:47-1753(+)